MDNIKLIAGRSNRLLAEGIADCLGIKLVDCEIKDFANSEIFVEIHENIRNKTVFVIQTGATSSDKKLSINDLYVETIQISDALRRSGVKESNVIYPTFPYARSDKKMSGRTAIMGAVIATGLKAAGYSRTVSMDLHSSQLQGFTHDPIDNIFAIKIHIDYLQSNVFKNMSNEEINQRFIIVGPDMGCSKRITDFGKRLKMKHAVMDKSRDYSTINVVTNTTLIGGDVRNRTAIIIDDMVDTFGTVISSVNELVKHGIKDAIVMATHGVLSDPAIERINNCDYIKSVVVCDTIDQSMNLKLCSKLHVVSTAPLFAKVIECIVTGQSISELFV